MSDSNHRGRKRSRGRDAGSRRPAARGRPGTPAASQRGSGESPSGGPARRKKRSGTEGAKAGGKPTSSRKAPGRSDGPRKGSTSQGDRRAAPSGGQRQRGSSGRGEASPQRTARRDLRGPAAQLPRWVVEDLARVTPDRQVAPALEALGEASEAIATGSYHKAIKKAQVAKQLAPRDVTVRETLGLAAYRVGNWKVALAELRTYRRLSGETTHMPVEMDIQRALDRPEAIEQIWEDLQRLGGKPAVLKEGAVVYASHLVDRGDLDAAWEVVKPGRLTHDPFEEDLRMWYVAARIAALRGQTDTAGRLRNAILEHDPSFPGIDELETLIARSGDL